MKELVIAGCPRSGTSALGRLLNTDPRVWITYEVNNHCFAEVGPQLEPGFHPQLVRASEFLQAASAFEEKAISKSLFTEYMGGPAEFMDHLYSETGLEVIGDKTPWYVLNNTVRNTKQFHPHIRFVFCVRDCRQIVSSCMRWVNDPKCSFWATEDIDKSANMWYEHTIGTMNSIKELDPGEYTVVRYETATKNPDRILKNIGNLIDFEFKCDTIGYQPTNADSWKEEMPDLTERLPKHCVELMELLGYYE
jgi:hypothetical protein